MQSAGAPHLWSRLVALIGRPELATDARFATVIARRANWPALLQILRDWLSRFDSVDQAVETLSGARIPAVPMLSPEEVVEHPQMAARSAFPEIDHPARGRVRVTALPFHVDGAPVAPGGPAPYRVGQHTRQVLTELGYNAERIEALQSLRVVEIPGET
jgi:crotonobetainyl-CoA:carnitine CoA-transferase CaiB-like acyl-CoA transferase